MRGKWIIGLVACLLFAPTVALAQTATLTPSPTVTITPTFTPDVNLFWTLPASTNEAGTPIAAQDVIFSYSADTGDVAIAVFAAALIVSLWVMFLIAVYLSRKGNP